MRTSYKGGAAALLCTALTISACGSSSKTSSAAPGKPAAQNLDGASIVAAAFTKTSAAKSARMSITYALNAGAAGSANAINERGTGSGVVDFTRKLADITVNEPTGQSIEERLIGTDAYVKLPPALAAASPQLHGKSWLHEQLPNDKSTSLGFGSSGSQASDPTSILRVVSAISNRVDKIGTDSIRGTEMTHYRATVDFAKAAAKNGISAAQITAMQQFLGSKTFPVDIWVDKQGAARRLQFHFPLPKASTTATAATGAITETLDLYDFGIPVTVTPPPASQIATVNPTATKPVSPSSGVKTG